MNDARKKYIEKTVLRYWCQNTPNALQDTIWWYIAISIAFLILFSHSNFSTVGLLIQSQLKYHLMHAQATSTLLRFVLICISFATFTPSAPTTTLFQTQLSLKTPGLRFSLDEQKRRPLETMSRTLTSMTCLDRSNHDESFYCYIRVISPTERTFEGMVCGFEEGDGQ